MSETTQAPQLRPGLWIHYPESRSNDGAYLVTHKNGNIVRRPGPGGDAETIAALTRTGGTGPKRGKPRRRRAPAKSRNEWRMKMNSYRIIDPISGKVIIEKNHRGDKTAQKWLKSMLDRGVIAGIPVQLQKRKFSDEVAAVLPPFANGQKQSPWGAI